jgi:hypothetical protein
MYRPVCPAAATTPPARASLTPTHSRSCPKECFCPSGPVHPCNLLSHSKGCMSVLVELPAPLKKSRIASCVLFRHESMLWSTNQEQCALRRRTVLSIAAHSRCTTTQHTAHRQLHVSTHKHNAAQCSTMHTTQMMPCCGTGNAHQPPLDLQPKSACLPA